ncbi:MAG: HNH endonuclease [Actinobacteria bacterium]|nr:HNH endonuclease [Actinomycetota bacterium]
MARTALDQLATQRPAPARRHRAGLVVQVDPLSGWGRLRDGEFLPPSSLEQVLRSLPGRQGRPRLRPLTAADLNLADLGRTRREPSQRLRELLGTIDGERCRFPSCSRHRNLHTHHAIWWSLGGPTDLANLVLV